MRYERLQFDILAGTIKICLLLYVIRLHDLHESDPAWLRFPFTFYAGVFGKISLKDGEGADWNKELVNMSYRVI